MEALEHPSAPMFRLQIIGWEMPEEGTEIMLRDNIENFTGLENHLLASKRVNLLNKIVARCLDRFRLGMFKGLSASEDFRPYYLDWCNVHKVFFVSYLHSSSQRTVCLKCHEEDKT